jgi:hypothetical protein
MLLPILASGQMYLDSYKFAAPQELLLDTYSGAAAAYSLRLLDKDYTGDCITVRRKSDDALDTFGFVNNYLDTTALKSFCGTGATDTCWVRIWFDQSGNGRNATSLTNSTQPTIIVSGVLNRKQSFPAIRMTNDIFRLDSLSSTLNGSAKPASMFFVTKKDNTNTNGGLLRARDGVLSETIYSIGYYLSTAKNEHFLRNTASVSASLTNATSYTTAINLQSFTSTGSTYTVEFNNISQGTFAYSGTFNVVQVGLFLDPRDGNQPFTGDSYEVVIYGSDQGSNRSGINSNINTFYSIY